MNFIYGLAEDDKPFLEVEYVGITDDLQARFTQHVKSKGNSKKAIWIRGLIGRGGKLRMIKLDSAEDRAQAESLEDYWIALGVKKEWALKNTIGVNWRKWKVDTDFEPIDPDNSVFNVQEFEQYLQNVTEVHANYLNKIGELWLARLQLAGESTVVNKPKTDWSIVAMKATWLVATALLLLLLIMCINRGVYAPTLTILFIFVQAVICFPYLFFPDWMGKMHLKYGSPKFIGQILKLLP